MKNVTHFILRPCHIWVPQWCTFFKFVVAENEAESLEMLLLKTGIFWIVSSLQSTMYYVPSVSSSCQYLSQILPLKSIVKCWWRCWTQSIKVSPGHGLENAVQSVLSFYLDNLITNIGSRPYQRPRVTFSRKYYHQYFR